MAFQTNAFQANAFQASAPGALASTVPAQSSTSGTLTVRALLAGSVPQAPSDSFTDAAGTLLESHTADTGQSWVEHPTATAGSHVISDENRVRCQAANALHYLNATPDSAEYDVVADHTVKSLINNNVGVGQAGRMNATAATFYHVRYNPLSTLLQWELFKFVAGTATLLGSFPQTLNVGQSYNVRLVIRDAYKAVEVDGVEVIRSADNAITAAGFAGIRSSVSETNTNGIHLDNFAAFPPTSSVAGTLTARAALTSTVAAVSSVSGIETVVARLVGASAAVSTTTGTLGASAALRALISAQSSLAGDLANLPPGVHLIGNIAASGTVTGTLKVTTTLVGASAAASSLTGQALVVRPLAGAITASSVMTGDAKPPMVRWQITPSPGWPGTDGDRWPVDDAESWGSVPGERWDLVT